MKKHFFRKKKLVFNCFGSNDFGTNDSLEEIHDYSVNAVDQ